MMPALAFFLLLAILWLVVAWLRRWPLGLSVLHALGFATGITLIGFGDALAVPYTVKASLVAAGAVVSTWAVDQILAKSREAKSAVVS
jgi:hypothetical protein